MAVGIASKSGTEAQRAALERELEGLRRKTRDQDEAIAYLGEEIARREGAAGGAATSGSTPESSPPPPAAPLPTAPPPDPAAAARARQDTDLSGLAIYAGMPGAPEKASRRFWMQAIEQLGRHLAPGATPAEQQRAALADPRGHAFVQARQACRE